MPYDSATQTRLEKRDATYVDRAIWVEGRNRSTGATEAMGFWTGEDHRNITIGGDSRLYYGAGTVIEMSEIRAGIRENVVYHEVVMPSFLDEVQQALRVYSPRLASVEIHSIPRDPETGELLTPQRMVKGILNEYRVELGETMDGYATEVTRLSISSAARLGTFSIPLYRSNTQMQRRNASDKFREFVDTAGVWYVNWGQKDE